MNKKRKIITTSLAVVLAVALLAGGTITYLSDSSGTVTNKFNTNEIKVDLDETGADDGVKDDYEIIPGTSEEKDPTITITSTVDSYLYVLVYGNNPTFTYTDEDGNEVTENIIDYAIAEGWTTLDYNNTSNDGYTDATLEYFDVDLTDLTTTEITIYYREVEASDGEQEFHVLENDVVSYSSEITDLSGYADGDIYLAFAAYAIQQKPFSSAADALTRTVVDSAEDLTEAISNGEPVTLSGDIEVKAADLKDAVASGDEAVIDLNSNTLTVTDSSTVSLSDGDSLTIVNGEVVANNTTSTTNAAFNIGAGSSITLENVTMTTSGCGIYPQGNAATVNIINSTITTSGAYCVSTNAGAVDNYNVVINIENSVLTASSDSGDNCPVLVNIPCQLNITDSTITGDRQGVVVRGGTATITDTSIITTGKFVDKDSTTNSTRLSGTWSSGNEVPSAALEVGNYQSSAYKYASTVTLENVTLTVQSNTDVIPAVYAASCGYTTTLTGASSGDTVLARVGTGEGAAASINSTSISTIESMTTVAGLSSTDTEAE